MIYSLLIINYKTNYIINLLNYSLMVVNRKQPFCPKHTKIYDSKFDKDCYIMKLYPFWAHQKLTERTISLEKSVQKTWVFFSSNSRRKNFSLSTATIIGHVIDISDICRVAISSLFSIRVWLMWIRHYIIWLMRISLSPLLAACIEQCAYFSQGSFL